MSPADGKEQSEKIPCRIPREPYCRTRAPTNLDKKLILAREHLPRLRRDSTFRAVSWNAFLVHELTLRDTEPTSDGMGLVFRPRAIRHASWHESQTATEPCLRPKSGAELVSLDGRKKRVELDSLTQSRVKTVMIINVVVDAYGG